MDILKDTGLGITIAALLVLAWEFVKMAITLAKKMGGNGSKRIPHETPCPQLIDISKIVRENKERSDRDNLEIRVTLEKVVTHYEVMQKLIQQVLDKL